MRPRQVVAVGRGFKSSKLLAAGGIVTDVLTEKYMTTMCKIRGKNRPALQTSMIVTCEGNKKTPQRPTKKRVNVVIYAKIMQVIPVICVVGKAYLANFLVVSR
jgi:hypothetical protein